MRANVICNSEISNLRSFCQLRGEQLVCCVRQVKVHDSYLLVSVQKCQKHQEFGLSILNLYVWDLTNLMKGAIPSSLIRVGQQKKGRHPAAPENQVKAVTFRHHGDRLRKATWVQDDT